MGDPALYLTYCRNNKDMSIEKIIYRLHRICLFCDQAMVAKVEGCTGFLIDGFPLDLEEAEKFEKQIVPVTRHAPLDQHTFHNTHTHTPPSANRINGMGKDSVP
jgi:hypothetical protein